MAHPAATVEPGLWFYNWKVWLSARPALTEAIASLGLDSREFWMLALVQMKPLRQHELAEMCGLDPSTLVAFLDALERRGWVERSRDPGDRRAHIIVATPEGSALYQRALPLARTAEEEQLRALSPAEQRRLLQLLRKLVHA